MSLTNHIKSGRSTDFFSELTKTIKHSLNSSKEKSSSGHSGSKQKTKSDKKSSRKTETDFKICSLNTMTIDGVYMEPIIISKFECNSEHGILDQSQPNSPINTPLALATITADKDMVVNSDMNMATIHNYYDTTTTESTPKQTPEATPDIIDHCKKADKLILPEETELEFAKSSKDIELTVSHTANTQTNKTKESGTGSEGKSANGAVDLVSVMNKMTLLVVLTVFTSTLSVVGNVFIEIHELKTIEKHHIDIQSIWASILPLIDNAVTSFMLYLQFKFTDNIYRVVLGKLDVLFLNVWLNILQCFWSKSTKTNAEKNMSFVFADKMQMDGTCDEVKE